MGARTSTQNSSVPRLLFSVMAVFGIFYSVKGDCRNFDFEDGPGSLTKWRKTGNAFDDQPTYGDNVRIRDPDINTNVQGDWWIGTFENRPNSTSDGGYFKGDYPRGTLTSPKFRITGPNINFLFGGGCDVGKLRAELLVRGKVVRQTVADGCNDKMQRRRWDVRPFKNKIAQIRLVDKSRRGHVNFDDFRGDFTCLAVPKNEIDDDGDDGNNHHGDAGNERDDNAYDNEDFTFTDEQQPPVETKTNEENSGDGLMTRTDDEYNAMNSSDAQNNTYEEGEDEYNAMGNSSDVFTSIYREKEIQDTENTPGGTKPISKSEANAKASKVADEVTDISSNPGANNKSAAVNDDLKDLFCKDYVAEINTGKPWDNDFLFTSNENYQATRREMEVKVLTAYEDDKDFRGAFFNKFSSLEEPDGVKAYFILKFRAYGKFLWRLVDALGKGNVTAAGCYVITPTVTPCPNFCPSTCAPSCQPSCCQTQVIASSPPQPVYQPTPAPMPPPPAPAGAYQPTTEQWNQALQVPASPQMSQLMAWPGSQCSTSCSPSCAPTCSSPCCHYFNYKRKASIAAFLKKQRLQEEKH